MLRADNKKIIMVEGDFGIYLPITITGADISTDESIKFTIKKSDGTELIEPKIYSNIKNNTFNLTFSKEESDKIKPGRYLYSIDWYKNNVFLGNVIKNENFQVEDK